MDGGGGAFYTVCDPRSEAHRGQWRLKQKTGKNHDKKGKKNKRMALCTRIYHYLLLVPTRNVLRFREYYQHVHVQYYGTAVARMYERETNKKKRTSTHPRTQAKHYTHTNTRTLYNSPLIRYKDASPPAPWFPSWCCISLNFICVFNSLPVHTRTYSFVWFVTRQMRKSEFWTYILRIVIIK